MHRTAAQLAQRRVRCAILRGGTSKGIFLRGGDLPHPIVSDEIDASVLRIFGSSAEDGGRQVDGLGGADPLTSKLAIVSPSTRDDADVDYTFAQVSTDRAFVDWAGNCGNISSAVGPFAVDEGLVTPVVDDDGSALVRIYQTNTDAVLTARFPLSTDGDCSPMAAVEGDCSIDGVPGTGAPVELDFSATAGAVFKRGLLPTGQPLNRLAISTGHVIEASIVDAGTPTVFVQNEDLQGLASEGEDCELYVERIRGAASVELGLVQRAEEAATKSPYLPFIAAIEGGAVESGVDLASRLFFMQQLHKAYPVTGAVATGAAARIPGTIVSNSIGSAGCTQEENASLRIGHPSGLIEIDVVVSHGKVARGYELKRAVMLRTARRLMDGVAYF